MSVLKVKKFFSVFLVLAIIIISLNIMQFPSSAESGLNYSISSKVENLMKNYNEEFSNIESEIDSNIEKYRKSDATIKVVDKNGNPVKNAEVKVNQTSHDFNFGINAVNLGQYDTAEKNAKYEKLIKDTFNLITTTSCFYIYSDSDNNYDFDYSEFRRPSLNTVNKFAKANNLRFKGQPLLADSWNPEWTGANNGATSEADLRNIYKNWFQGVKNQFGSDAYLFDLVNESTLWGLSFRTNPKFTFANKNGSYSSEAIDSNVEWAFETGKEIFSDSSTLLEINDTYDYIDAYKIRLKQLADKNLIDSIGMQYHLFNWGQENSKSFDLNNHIKRSDNTKYQKFYLTDTYNNLKEVSELGVPLNISEITIPSYNSNYTKEEGQAIQAEIAKRLYKMWFSIPNMNGIIFWNLIDGEHYGNEGDVLGCLVDSNFNPKPAYYVIQNYINNEWRTNENIVTDENGMASFRGFHGEYLASVKVDNQSAAGKFKVLKNGENNIVLQLDDINEDFNNQNIINEDNLSDLSTWGIGGYNNDGIKFNTSESACTNGFISVNSNHNYTLRANGLKIKVCEYDFNGKFIKSEEYNSGSEFVTGENCGYITLTLSGNVGNNIISDISAGTLKVSINSWITPAPKASSDSPYMTLEQVNDPFFWQAGHYSSSTGAYEKYTNRICLRKLIPVFSDKKYKFSADDVVENNTIQFILREFGSSGTYLRTSAVLASGDEYTPSANTAYVAVSANIKGDVGGDVFSLKKAVSNNVLNPTATVINETPNPDEPAVIPEVSTDYNLLNNGGSWVKGHYLGADWKALAGILDDGTNDKANAPYRIALNKKVDVVPGLTYSFDVGCDLSTVKFVIRGYNASGNLTTFTPATSIKQNIKIPADVVQLGVAVYDTRTKSGPTSEAFLAKINDGTLNPTITNPLEVHSSMLRGASIRLKKSGNGIRFYTNIDKDRVELLRSSGAVVEMGTLIAPKNIIGSKPLTHDVGIEYKDYIDVKYTADEYFSENSFSGIVGSITEIREPNNVARDFVGRGYIRVTKNGESYTAYSNYYNNNIENNTRSLQFVAKAVKNDSQFYDQLSDVNKAMINKWAN